MTKREKLELFIELNELDDNAEFLRRQLKNARWERGFDFHLHKKGKDAQLTTGYDETGVQFHWTWI